MAQRVLMFGWEFPPHNSGGLGTACEGLVRAMTRQGTKVTFVLPKRLQGLPEDRFRFRFAAPEEYSEVCYEEVGISSPLSPYLSVEEYRKLVKEGKWTGDYAGDLFSEVRRYARHAGRVAAQEPHDVIHAHDWLAFRSGVEAKKVSGKPLVVHVHATEYDRTADHPNPLILAEEHEGLAAADRIVAVSLHTKKILVARYGIDPAKIAVVHNGIEQAPRKDLAPMLAHWREEGKKIVLFVGRITIQKGPEYFLRMASRVLAVEPDAIFVVAGSGDMYGRMITMAAELGISDHVFFAGFIRGNDLVRLYRAADLYVMPSVSEPFGLTALEAISEGTPVLVSRQSGVAEVVHNALVADFWDVDAMADKVVGSLRAPGIRATLAVEGARDAARATWESAAEKLAHLYEEISR